VLLVIAILTPVLPALLQALRRVLEAFAAVASLLRDLAAALAGALDRRLPPIFSTEALEELINSPAVQTGSRWGLVAALAAVAAVVFWLALRRLGLLSRLDDDEVRDSVFSPGLLLAQLRGLFGRRRRRPPAPAAYLPLEGPADDARLIARRAYQAMLEWAQARSLPRAAAQTPVAYADALAGALPQCGEAVRTITSAYQLARYAAEAPSLDAARSAAGAAARLQSLSSGASPAG
jgi:hypothetical protein